MAAELPKIISVDDHVVEPAHLWDRWLPDRYRARGPHVERRGIGTMKHIGGGVYEQTFDDDGPKADCWVYEDLVYINKRHVAAVGFDRDDMTMSPITYDEMRPGCYDPKARVDDMEMNWVDASLSFPTFPRFCGQTFLEAKDRELAHACVLAYNDWMVDEWCGDSNGRLIPLTIVPLWDPALAAAEVERNAARGVHAVCFSEIPSKLGLPTIHSGEWDPFFATCQDTDTVVCMHIGSSSQMPATSADAPVAVAATLSFNNAMASLSDFLFSGVLVRFPQLTLAYSEGQIGWLPYVLERADDVWREHRAWGGVKRHHSRTAVDLLLPAGLRLLLPRSARARVARSRRRRQHHVRDRLPAHRLDVAGHEGRRRGPHGSPPRRGCVQDRARQRDPHAVARSRLLIVTRIVSR